MGASAGKQELEHTLWNVATCVGFVLIGWIALSFYVEMCEGNWSRIVAAGAGPEMVAFWGTLLPAVQLFVFVCTGRARQWPVPVVWSALTMVLLVAAVFFRSFRPALPDGSTDLAIVVGAVAFALPSGCLVIGSVHRLVVTGRMKKADGVPRCLTCQYDLTGNTSGTCPECGTQIQTVGQGESVK